MQDKEIQARLRATELHTEGLNCAEAVLQAVLEARGVAPGGWIPRIATPFGAGVGRSREELCGALSGGLLAMGWLHGRDRIGQDPDLMMASAMELREQFAEHHGCTRCSEILESLGPQENGHLCKRLSGETAALTMRLLATLD